MRIGLFPGTCILLGLLLLLGCARHGPAQLRQGKLAYNCAVKSSVDEELLLNIVRIRYVDTVEFLSASSISTQSEIRVDLGARVGELGQQDFSGGSADVGWASRPTFTFVPQRGREFATRLMAPISLDTLTYIASSSWNLEVLLRLFVSEINGISNEVGGVEQMEFGRIAALLGRLQNRGDILVGFVEEPRDLSPPIPIGSVSPGDYVNASVRDLRYVPSEDGSTVTLTGRRRRTAVLVEPRSSHTGELASLLGLDPGKMRYFTVDTGGRIEDPDPADNAVSVRTRSLLVSMAFLSQGVHVPPRHIEDGVTTLDWPVANAKASDLTGFFQVRSCTTRPRAGVAVPYRGHWFYIPDDDTLSKRTFLMFATLYRLMVTESDVRQAPVLTLPVG